MMRTAMKTGGVALLAFTLSGCGWFRADLPVRNGPQSEPHVTYATSGEVARQMTSGGYATQTLARSICGARSASAAQNAAIASGRFDAPAATNPDASGARSILFNDRNGTAVMITTGPGGYHCTWSDWQSTSTWRNGVPA